MALPNRSGPLPERNEVYEIRTGYLDETGNGDDSVTYALGVNINFPLEVPPPKEPFLRTEWTGSIFLDPVVLLNQGMTAQRGTEGETHVMGLR